MPPAGHFSPDLFARELRDIFHQRFHHQSGQSPLCRPPLAAHRHRAQGQRTAQCRSPLCPQYSRSPALNRDAGREGCGEEIPRRAWRHVQPRRASPRQDHLPPAHQGSVGPGSTRHHASLQHVLPDRPIEVTPTPAEVRDRAVWVVEHFERAGNRLLPQGCRLVTAAHCVKGVDEVEVYHPSKHANTFKATVLKRDDHRDLAILEHQIPATEYFELEPATHPIAAGDR